MAELMTVRLAELVNACSPCVAAWKVKGLDRMSRPLKPSGCHDEFAQPYSNNTVPGVEFYYSLGQRNYVARYGHPPRQAGSPDL